MKNSTFSPNHAARGYAVAMLAAAILSTTAIFIRYLTQTYQIPSLVLAFWRDVFVVLTLLPALGLLRPALLRIGRRHLPYLAFYGLVLAAFNALWTLSVALNGAAVATVLVYCSAAFTALLGWWLLKEGLGAAKLAAIVLCLSGCALVADALNLSAWQSNLAGILTGMLAGLSYAAYSLMGRAAAQRNINPWTVVFYTFCFATGYLFIFNGLPDRFLPGTAAHLADFFWLRDSLPGWVALFALAAGPTVLGFGLYNVSLGYLPSSIANLIVTTEPAFTAVIAYFFLGERLTVVQGLGSLLILAGVVVLRLFEGRLAGKGGAAFRRSITSVPAGQAARDALFTTRK
ncbi:MAG: DMT family transporter [Chloroflexota bacterium]